MQKSKKVRMPAGIRNKLMAAVAMLLVSSIMMVSSTYAWFTLSTAPEVTGITTSVGANGNLEIALLTTATAADMNTITSAVGNSSAAANQTVAGSNITWGNLVDLSAAEYGLTNIALMPAAPNATYVTDDQGTVTTTLASISVVNPLLIAEYGADGRVSTVQGQTVSAVANENGAFAFDNTQTYGVRAIGTTSDLSVREIALRNAKSTVSAAQNTAKAASRAAINNNLPALVGFATATTTPDAYTADEIAAFRTIANAVIADLTTLETGYKSAAIASAAAKTANDDEFADVKAIIDPMTLTQLAGVASDYDLNGTAMLSLVSAQAAAAEAKAVLDVATPATAATDIETAVKKLVAGAIKDGNDVYITSGAIGELGNQLGTYDLASALGSTVYAGTKDSTTATYVAIANTVNGLNITSGGSTTSNITDTYGYIIDFAFRTNASGSNLQLQTAAANRVYTDQTNAELATQGAGSNVTYAFASGMTETQVNALLGAIRLVFLDTANGTVYATAGLTDIVVGDAEATANVKLTGQGTATVAPIVALAQNTATAISVLVYLDGNEVDNADVANAASSGMLNLNLQFSSSAELVPMQNTALQTMTAYTVSFNANGGTGIMPDAKAYSATYTLPTTTTFTAPSGKVFDGWSTTANDANTKVTTVTEATTVYAVWVDAPAAGGEDEGNDEGNQTTTYNVTVPTGVNGNTTVAKDGTYTFTLVDGYTLGTVTMGGTEVTPTLADGTYTIANVTGDIVINVTAPQSYSITITDNSSVLASKPESAIAGSTVTLTAAEGKVIGGAVATDADGNTINLENYSYSEGTAVSFTMPAYDIIIVVSESA